MSDRGRSGPVARPYRGRASAALVLTSLLALAVPASALTIAGRVTKGTGVAASGLPVSLHILRGNEEIPGATVATDRTGAFRFTGLEDRAGLEYYVATEYEGAFYTEGPIATAGKREVTQDVLVYDVGKEFDAIHVQDHHIIVERQSDGLHVTEIMVFQNGAQTAYLGVGVNHASASGMRVGLPASVKEFKPGLGLDESTAHLQGRELTSSRPVPPGQRPISFTYTVPLSGRMDLSHRVYFPTHQFTIMLDDPTLHLESAQLKSAGSREQGGKNYALYIGSEFPVGSEVSIRVGGAGFFSNPKVYPFLVAPFVIAGVLIFASRRGRQGLRLKRVRDDLAAVEPQHATVAAPANPVATGPATISGGTAPALVAPAVAPRQHGRSGFVATSDGDDIAQTYLYLIAALDQGVERGEISPEGHALVRGNLKRRLEVILASEEPRSKSR